MARGATTMTKAQLEVAHAGAGATSQVDDSAPDPWTPTSAIRPPLSLDQLAGLTMIPGIRRSCIAAITLNTVGLGLELKVRKGRESDLAGEDEPTDLATRLDEMARRDKRLGHPDFTRLLSAAKWDEQEVGNGYVEVSRNRLTGEIDGFYHVPGKRIRRRSDHDGWIMGPRARSANIETIRFYDFGEKVAYDDNGAPTATLNGKGRRWDQNELIAFQLYTSASRDYGLPPDAQLAIDYLGDKLAAKANVGYFDNSAVPPTVIFVQGREVQQGEAVVTIEVDQKFVRAIGDTLKAGGGRDRVAIVPVPPGTKTEAHNLAVLSERDLGFVSFRADNRRRTLGAWRISPVFVADIEDAGKYTAEVERAITKEQVFDSEQRRWSDILGQTVIRELAPHLQVAFHEIEIKGDEARRESANDLADRGRITNGDYRAAHGYPPMPEATEGAEPQPGEVPAGWNSELIEAKAIPAQLGTPEIPAPLAKAGRVEREIAETFDDAVDEAIRRVHALVPDANLAPVVVEKDGDSIRIHALNGTGE